MFLKQKLLLVSTLQQEQGVFETCMIFVPTECEGRTMTHPLTW